MRDALLRALGDAHPHAHREAEPVQESAPASAQQSAPQSARLVAFPGEQTGPALLRVLWTLTAILGVGMAGVLAVAWYLALTR